MIGEVKIKEGFSESLVEEIMPFQYSITSYGTDYPVDGLVKRIKKGDICFNTPLELPPQPRLTGGYHNRIESLGTDFQLTLTSRV